MTEHSPITPPPELVKQWKQTAPHQINEHEHYHMTDFLSLKFSEKQIACPKHGTHEHYISSTIEGYEGYWRILCWIESLGPSLPLVEEQIDD